MGNNNNNISFICSHRHYYRRGGKVKAKKSVKIELYKELLDKLSERGKNKIATSSAQVFENDSTES